MDYIIGTHYAPCTIKLLIRSLKPCTVRVKAYDRDRENTVLMNRFQTMVSDQESEILVQMPLTPKIVMLSIGTEAGNLPVDQETNFTVVKIKQYASVPTKLSAVGLENVNVANFVDLIQRFCFNAGTLPTNAADECYCSSDPDKKFKIQYLPFLTDPTTGVRVSTPMRIHQVTGVIQVAQDKILDVSVPGRIVMGTHEFSHKFENKNPNNELEADLNGLSIYLGLGYPRYEAIETYSKVFYVNATDANLERFQHIEKFVKDFDNL